MEESLAQPAKAVERYSLRKGSSPIRIERVRGATARSAIPAALVLASAKLQQAARRVGAQNEMPHARIVLPPGKLIAERARVPDWSKVTGRDLYAPSRSTASLLNTKSAIKNYWRWKGRVSTYKRNIGEEGGKGILIMILRIIGEIFQS